MTIGRYDACMFVWTDEGYKNSQSMHEDLNILTMNLGQQEFADCQYIYTDLYTGPMIKVFDNSNKLMLAVTSGQRMFWFPRIGKPQIGTAGEFFDQVQTKSLIIATYDDNRIISHYVEKSQVRRVEVTNYPVWGVQSSSGNLILKADSVPILFSDSG